jgi:type IV secretory pathway protease TraF
MAPGLGDGEVISWLPAQTDTYQRYGRVVCKYKDELITKRIMGLPGESIRIADGELIINGKMLRKSPRLLQHFGLIVDCQSESWRDATQSWEHSSNNWVCEHVSSKHVSWLHFHPKISSGLIPDGSGVLVYDDVSWLPKETRRLEVVKDVGISAVLDIALQEECGLEILVGINQHMARLVVRRQGRLALIAGRLDGQFVVMAWPILRQHREFHEGFDGIRTPLVREIPEEWSAEVKVVHEKTQPQAKSSLLLGIKLLAKRGEVPSEEICSVKAEELLVWRDIRWLATPSRSKWSVPAGHVFVLGDCPPASRDSRHWGSLPIDSIQGKVVQPSSGEPLPFWLHQN